MAQQRGLDRENAPERVFFPEIRCTLMTTQASRHIRRRARDVVTANRYTPLTVGIMDDMHHDPCPSV